MALQVLRNVGQLLELVDRLHKTWSPGTEGLWYRGTRSTSFTLAPSFYRHRPIPEHRLALDFIALAEPLLEPDLRPRSPETERWWEWYFLMQHYGCPTRLLDWTESPLVALYFAIRELSAQSKSKRRGTPCLWVLSPDKLCELAYGEADILVSRGKFAAQWLFPQSERDTSGVLPSKPVTFSHEGKAYSNNAPVAIYPYRKNPRILAQRGVFTVHGADTRGLENMYPVRTRKSPLRQYAIDLDCVDTMAQQLLRLGVLEFTLFPELPSLAGHLKRIHGIE